ncbi:hypothetical protein NP493_238g03001 [Ridgeia piscesae]|uniref:Uncharacterized protein n=1 Tax=Ridgeia piscesae TaxID=27915 RepID=A0AAD9NZQ6_RIDPI|nr:hypothetical protein NP493_238g03001 [Ridgeia piscesae]
MPIVFFTLCLLFCAVPLEIPKNFHLKPGRDVTQTTADLVWDAVNTGPWRVQGFFRGYKIQYWKTLEGPHTMREHSIIYREPDNCWLRGRAKRRRDVTSGHLYKLWPFTNTTAQKFASERGKAASMPGAHLPSRGWLAANEA